MNVKVAVRDLRKGDKLATDGPHWWVALADAVDHGNDRVTLHVRHPDGGDGIREWRSPHTLVVERG